MVVRVMASQTKPHRHIDHIEFQSKPMFLGGFENKECQPDHSLGQAFSIRAKS